MILAIDTSGRKLGLALCKDEAVLASSLSEPELRHGAILQTATDDILRSASAGFNDLTGVSVTLGPGSFTGLRMGLAAGKAYARSLNIPLTGISTLYAGAHGIKNMSGDVMVIIDARKGEYYYARFDCSGGKPVRLAEDSVNGLDHVKKSINDNTILFGPEHLMEQFVAETGQCDYHISDNFNLAEPAGIRGEEKILKGDILDYVSAVPVYLRAGF